MILEVNNTFDERRPYFLPRESISSLDSSTTHTAASLSNDPSTSTRPRSENADSEPRHTPRFLAHWPKDFHVSPFNSRKGNYQLSVDPPAFATGKGINNTITLSSSKAHAKLVARIFSTAAPLDVTCLSAWQLCKICAHWGWVGFATYPRILYEAARLFFRRKLHVWYRPEVLASSIGRKESSRERFVERLFRAFLEHRVMTQADTGSDDASGAVSVKYIAAVAQPDRPAMECFQLARSKPTMLSSITLHILSPQFYTDVALAHSQTKYLRNAARLPPEQRTFECSDVDKLIALLGEATFVQSDTTSAHADVVVPTRSPDKRDGAASLHENAAAAAATTRKDTQAAHSPCLETKSAIISFITANYTPSQASQYIRTLRALRWARAWAGDMPFLLDFGLVCARVAIVFVVMRWVVEGFVDIWLDSAVA